MMRLTQNTVVTIVALMALLLATLACGSGTDSPNRDGGNTASGGGGSTSSSTSGSSTSGSSTSSTSGTSSESQNAPVAPSGGSGEASGNSSSTSGSGGSTNDSAGGAATGDDVAGGNAFTVSNDMGRVDNDMGYLYLTGEITNTSGRWVKAVRIDFQLLDGSGNEIFTDRTYAYPFVAAPGGTLVYEYVRPLSAINGTYASHKVEVSAIVTTDEQQGVVENVVVEDDGDYVMINGTFRSSGRDACFNPQPIAAMYTASGKLYRVEAHSPTDAQGNFYNDLPAGNTLSFSFGMSKPTGEAMGEVKVWASCGG